MASKLPLVKVHKLIGSFESLREKREELGKYVFCYDQRNRGVFAGEDLFHKVRDSRREIVLGQMHRKGNYNIFVGVVAVKLSLNNRLAYFFTLAENVAYPTDAEFLRRVLFKSG